MRTSPVAARIVTVARKKYHQERDAGEETARAVESLHAEEDVDERETNRDCQRGGVDAAGPRRRGANGRQRRADKVNRHEAAEHIRIGETLAQRQRRAAGAHDDHGADEQQPAPAVDEPALLRHQRHGAEPDGKSACGNVNR